jgi:hypothetical protein
VLGRRQYGVDEEVRDGGRQLLRILLDDPLGQALRASSRNMTSKCDGWPTANRT